MINAEFVEKALLGAILNEPSSRQDVPWLEVDDFTNPLCRALWQHLQAGEADCAPPIDYVTLSDALRRETDLHRRLTAPSQIAELQIQAPTRPDPAAYGQIIVEVAIRNQLITLGLKIGTTAEQNPQPDHAQLSASMQAIGDLGRRWERTHPPSAPSEGDARGNRGLLDIRPAHRLHDGQQTHSARDLATAETAAVVAAVHDSPKGSRPHLLATVRPSDFSRPRTAATFKAVQHLASTGSHVDEITVAWELIRGVKDQGPGLEINELRRNALISHLEPGDIQTITNASAQRSVAIAATKLVRAAEDLRTELPAAGRGASESLGETTKSHLRQSRSSWQQPGA